MNRIISLHSKTHSFYIKTRIIVISISKKHKRTVSTLLRAEQLPDYWAALTMLRAGKTMKYVFFFGWAKHLPLRTASILLRVWCSGAFSPLRCAWDIGSWHVNKKCQHTFEYAYMHTCMLICIHKYIHAYMHTYIHAYIHIYMHTYIHTYTNRYIHTFTHLYIRKSTDTCTCILNLKTVMSHTCTRQIYMSHVTYDWVVSHVKLACISHVQIACIAELESIQQNGSLLSVDNCEIWLWCIT